MNKKLSQFELLYIERFKLYYNLYYILEIF